MKYINVDYIETGDVLERFGKHLKIKTKKGDKRNGGKNGEDE